MRTLIGCFLVMTRHHFLVNYDQVLLATVGVQGIVQSVFNLIMDILILWTSILAAFKKVSTDSVT